MKYQGKLKNSFLNFCRIFILAFLCVAFSFVLVFPLCKWAQKSPKSYTMAILILICAGIIFFCIKSIVKKGIFSFLKIFVPAAVFLACLLVSFIFLKNLNIALALIFFVAAWILLFVSIKLFNLLLSKKSS